MCSKDTSYRQPWPGTTLPSEDTKMRKTEFQLSQVIEKQTRSQFYYNMGSTVVKLYNRVLESKDGFSETCWSL